MSRFLNPPRLAPKSCWFAFFLAGCGNSWAPVQRAQGAQEETVRLHDDAVRILSTREGRWSLFRKDFPTSETSILVTYPRERFFTPWNGRTTETFAAYFLAADGTVRDAQILPPGEAGITSRQEARHMLLTVLSPVLLGDPKQQLSDVKISGCTEANTDGGRLYWTLLDENGTRRVDLYRASGRRAEERVAYGRRKGDGPVELEEVNRSRLGGRLTVTFRQADTDDANVLDLLPFRGKKVEFPPSLAAAKIEDMYEIQVGKAKLRVELAISEEEKQRGLMHRKAMSEGEGMLFAYPSPRLLRFWMGHCYFPLSLAYVREDWTISEFHDMDPYPDPENPGEDYQTWASREEVKYVIEVNRDWFRNHGVAAGDRVAVPPEVKRLLP